MEKFRERSSEVLPVKSQVEKELTLRDLLQIYHRRRSVVYGVLLTFCILAAIYCTLCTRRYQATGTVQVQKEGADAMGLETLMNSATGGGSDALEATIELQTQSNILQSDSLALRTIESLGMEDTYDFRPHWSPVGWILGKISPQGISDPVGAKLGDSPQRRQRALSIFSKKPEGEADQRYPPDRNYIRRPRSETRRGSGKHPDASPVRLYVPNTL